MQEIYDAVMDGRDISRRAFLKGTAVAGLMALGAGCLGKSDSPGKTPSHQNIEPPIPYYVNGRKIGEFHVPVKIDSDGWIYLDEVNKNPDGSYAYDFTNPLDVFLADQESCLNKDPKLSAIVQPEFTEEYYKEAFKRSADYYDNWTTKVKITEVYTPFEDRIVFDLRKEKGKIGVQGTVLYKQPDGTWIVKQ